MTTTNRGRITSAAAALLFAILGPGLAAAQCPPQWLTYIAGSNFQAGDVRTLAVYNGELIAGGSISARDYVVRWNGDGWQTLGNGMDESVLAFSVFQGDLVAGGYFKTAGGLPALHVARWDGTNWHPLGAGVPTPVHALIVYDGQLIAGAEDRIDIWDGQNWTPLATVRGDVLAFAEYGGELIAGGSFLEINGARIYNIARWDGARWNSMGPGPARVNCLTLHDGDLIAGASGVARWDGSSWTFLGDDFTGVVLSLAPIVASCTLADSSDSSNQNSSETSAAGMEHHGGPWARG
jgi:hypothetical protein